MATKKSKKKKNNSLFMSALVLLSLLLILLAFLVNKNRIITNFKETGFFDRVFGSTPEFVEKHEIASSNVNSELGEANLVIEEKAQKKHSENKVVKNTKNNSEVVNPVLNLKTENINPEIQETPKEKTKEDPKIEKPSVKPESIAEENKKREVKVEEKIKEIQNSQKEQQSGKKVQEVAAPVATIDLQLCFVAIDGDGSVVRKIIKRKVQKNDSPLTTAINLLLKGPDYSNSVEKNLQSLIPKDARLLSARVQNGIAYLNFNDRFEYNQEGTIGTINQLMQVVYTATSFSTVTSVQFLIDGKKQEYLGSEGIWIGSPLSRANF